jgi:hypothetical protein
MKLLRDFPRLCIAGLRAASGRRALVPCAFNVTVPAPLARPANDNSAVVIELPRTTPVAASPRRREPASFLKAVRHRQIGSNR